jgi:hypothetical protein
MTIKFKLLFTVIIISGVLFSPGCTTVNNTTVVNNTTMPRPETTTLTTKSYAAIVAVANAELATVRTAMQAAMADAQTFSLPGTGGSALTVTLDSSHDFYSDSTHKISDYIQGGNAVVKGSYSFDARGNVVSGSYPGITGFTATIGGIFK